MDEADGILEALSRLLSFAVLEFPSSLLSYLERSVKGARTCFAELFLPWLGCCERVDMTVESLSVAMMEW